MTDVDLLIVGSGVAGLTAAVRAAARSLSVGIVTKGVIDQATTRWAQGGVAAVLGGDPDSTDLHLADTLRAGAGLCDSDAVRVLVDEGPARVTELIALGASFDRDHDGALMLALEGGHSVARIVHAGGAATGAEVERALVAATVAEADDIRENHFALDLLVDGDRCVGVRAVDAGGDIIEIGARNVLIAAGGAGQLFSVTTNPTEATGDGIAMARRAGAVLADMEFVQFHPTALHHPVMPRPLLSEALRGHGAVLRDGDGERFVDELLPRDVVARAIQDRLAASGAEHVWLDCTAVTDVAKRFPTITATLAAVGLDPTTDWLPVAPAAHYLCGGIATDLSGASSLGGLWAAGETACTGVHGANRLASNSLLEGMVFAARAVEAIVAGVTAHKDDGVFAAPVLASVPATTDADGPVPRVPVTVVTPGSRAGRGASGLEHADAARRRLQALMTGGAGVVRSAQGLAGAAAELASWTLSPAPHDVATAEVNNLVELAAVVVAAAAARDETRGGHTRVDHPGRDDRYRVRFTVGP